MNYLDLFSGIGGFALGLYWAGWRFDEHYFSEVDEYAIKIYRQRFPDAVPIGDIISIDTKVLADTESMRKLQSQGGKPNKRGWVGNGNQDWIITGGFPCQDISTAGKGAGIKGRRSGLWFEMWRVIRELRPRWVVAENVGAITHRGLGAVVNSLAKIGYDCEWTDIRASDMGAPHRRERIWIIAYPNGQRLQRRFGRKLQECSSQQFIGQGSTQALADTGRSGRIQQKESRRETGERSGDRSQDVAYPGLQRQAQHEKQTTRIEQCGSREWWAVEPDVGRVAHGIPSRVDRLKGLGNSIVPQIAEMIFRQIGKNENHERR